MTVVALNKYHMFRKSHFLIFCRSKRITRSINPDSLFQFVTWNQVNYMLVGYVLFSAQGSNLTDFESGELNLLY